MTSIELRTSILAEIELSEDDDRHNRYFTTDELRKKTSSMQQIIKIVAVWDCRQNPEKLKRVI